MSYRTFPALLVGLVILIHGPVVLAADKEDDLLEKALRGNKNDMELFYEAMSRAELNTDEAWKTSALKLDLPYATLELDGGWIVPVVPAEYDEEEAAGRDLPEAPVISAVYVGPGRFNYTAPHETERWLMNYSLHDLTKKTWDEDGVAFELDGGAVLFFLKEWTERLEAGRQDGTIDKKSAAAAKRFWKARGDLFQGSVASAHHINTLSSRRMDHIMVDLPAKGLRGVPWLTYEFNPTEKEAVSLGVLKRWGLNRDSIRSWSLGSWFSPEQAGDKSDRELGYERTRIDHVDVDHYNLDMTVYRDPDTGYWGMRVQGTVDLEVLWDETPFIRLALMSFGENEWDPNGDPDIQKVSSSNRVRVKDVKLAGESLEFLHKGHQLLAMLPRNYKKGEKLQLEFDYQGLFIMTIKQPPPTTSLVDSGQVTSPAPSVINFRVPNNYPWYPQNGTSLNDSFTFDWKLKLPKPMIAATSGTLLAMEDDGTFNVHVIKETTPVTFPAILFGRFSVIENDPNYEEGQYKIRVYVHPGYEKGAQSFLDEAAGVISYYEALFGPYPFQELDLAQMPLGMGYAQAPAGIIQMDGLTYISKTDLANLFNWSDPTNLREAFIPHEIAHEWWGHKAGWGSTRDQWVSETFAEYASALYIEAREAKKSGDPADRSGYEDRKDRWGAVGRFGHTFKRTGPVWIGNSLGSRRQAAIYARGPLLLDMLRENFGREAVVKMMYAWCEYADQNDGLIVTEDLQMILEKVIPGVGFEEFMNKYIKGNEPLPDDPKIKQAEKAGRSKY
ncbi:MAG TPA: hypothetical protein DIU15_02220 [Deltaproteobacteria bacterium]|nr:hypothetical protein [Deltaproteobacteria bacterium]HCP44834.1 hypothetical protein [Deltaproteobacteria bacterium]